MIDEDYDYSQSAQADSPVLIRDMALDQRPRERAMAHGIKTLSDAELMAVIFATGIKGKSVVTLCEEMLADQSGHLSLLSRMSVKEICTRFKGIGPAKAISLLAALELGSRSAADAAMMASEMPLNTSRRAYDRMRWRLERLDHEEFWAILLSRSGRELRHVKIGQGAIAATVVDVRQLIRAALECQATGVILFHNHPSGTLVPSPQDDAVTSKIREACKLFDMSVNDHIIITDSDFYSYYDNGKMY